jgi:hypothetical protein
MNQTEEKEIPEYATGLFLLFDYSTAKVGHDRQNR